MGRYTVAVDACVLVPIGPRDGGDASRSRDRHVVAVAIRGRADAIVTAKLADFPAETLDPLGIDVVGPDEFLLDQLDLTPAS